MSGKGSEVSNVASMKEKVEQRAKKSQAKLKNKAALKNSSAAGSGSGMVFNDYLKDDTDGKYWMYFKNANGNLFDTSSAIIVEDDTGTPITGTITSNTISFTFDYAGNVQGGRTAGTDAVVIIVAMGLADAEWIEAEFTITEATGLSFPVNAGKELTYSNAA